MEANRTRLLITASQTFLLLKCVLQLKLKHGPTGLHDLASFGFLNAVKNRSVIDPYPLMQAKTDMFNGLCAC